jgi:predicted nucleic acid-binding protein
MIVVANAGPLIALAHIGHFSLLQSLYGRLYIPPAVRDEVVVSGRGRPGVVEVGAAAWIDVVAVRDMTAVQLLQERLDAGESQAIVLAIELDAELLLMDEARGRRIAEARGLNKTGTLGALIMAKKRGLILAVTPLLDELRAGGFRMDEELYQAARALAGEEGER